MMYDKFFADAIRRLREERRYRVFVIDGVNHPSDHGRGYEIVRHLRFIPTENPSGAGGARPNSYG